MNLGVVLPRDRFPWGTTFFIMSQQLPRNIMHSVPNNPRRTIHYCVIPEGE
jgi:IS30 family transposase